MKKAQALPLSGVRVLDLTQIYNGPYATFLMAAAGATVIKIEPPDGEHLRKRPESLGVADPFVSLNANKRSMTMNLKNPAAKDLFLRMVVNADVVVENFAPGVMERLGLGESVLRGVNPKLVYASGSGYGSSGPYRDYPAMDLTIQAMSGVLSVTGGTDEAPVKAGPAICDFSGGIHLYGAIMTALYQRQVTGVGSTVEVSMMSSVVPSFASNLGSHKAGDATKRTGNRHGGLTMAPYNVYPTADGHIAILTVSDKHWESLTEVLGCPQLCYDPRYATRKARIARMDELDAEIAALTVRDTKDVLFDRLISARVPCAPVRELDEIVHDEHLHATGMLKWIDHPEKGRLLVHGSPIVFKDQPAVAYAPSSPLGAHTREVLAELCGMSESEFLDSQSKGAFSR